MCVGGEGWKERTFQTEGVRSTKPLDRNEFSVGETEYS